MNRNPAELTGSPIGKPLVLPTFVRVFEPVVVETIVQTCLYAGIPATLNALAIAKDVFARRGYD